MSEQKKPKNDKIFRKAALERLSSPDQLDTLMQITTPRAWLALGVVLAIFFGLVLWSILGELNESVEGIGFLTTAATVESADNIVVAPAAGNLTTMNVTEGDGVTEGQVVAQILLANNNTLDITATVTGEVSVILADPGTDVSAEQPIMFISGTPLLTDTSEPLQSFVYIPFIDAQDLEEGMEVRISPISFPAQEYGFLLGRIEFVGQSIASDSYASAAFPNESVVQVIVSLNTDDTPSGYEWTLADGPDGDVLADSPVQATIIVSETSPISRVFPVLGE